MADKDIFCVSCKKRVTNVVGTTRFPCPNCGKYEMIRCAHCRNIVVKYNCPKCGFEGPN